ncbi:MAG: RidA family protein [Saprospiraceae bacterium]|nr:RidA family protein [Saprospiraceae bacterium]
MNTNRRSVFKKISLSLAGMLGLVAAKATGSKSDVAAAKEEPMDNVVMDQGVPLFSGARTHGNLLFIAGKGAHFDGDITAHTKHVLDEVQKELEKNGSSMNKVLKCNVYLNDLKDYQAMNAAYKGRFGDKPPVRTTIAAAGGIPGDSLVEIDCIAYID